MNWKVLRKSKRREYVMRHQMRASYSREAKNALREERKSLGLQPIKSL